MLRIKIIWRFIAILFCLSTLLSAATLIFFGFKAIWFGIGAGAAIVIFSSLFAETWVRRALKVNSRQFKGLDRTLEAVSSELGVLSPELVVFSDPVPDVFVVRSIRGQGLIAVSQGLVSLVREDEFRAILRIYILKVGQPGILLQSVCLIWVALIASWAPQAWVSLVFSHRSLSELEERHLTPSSAIRFLMLFPIVQFLIKTGQQPEVKDGLPCEAKSADAKFARLSAVHKVHHAIRILGSSKNRHRFSSFSLRSSYNQF